MSSKAKTAVVKSEGKPALTPKLRFPDFRDADGWEPKTLGEACLRITNGKANAQDHEEDGTYPLFDRSAVIKRSSEFIFDAEAVILPGEGMRFVPKYFRGKFNLHQRAYALMDHRGDARFVYYSLDYLQNAMAKKAVKSTVLSLRLPIVENFVIGCPKPAEQQKIAECLSSVDEVIAAQARKLDALKAHKKGLMQYLFPREGETQPRLRFPEFQGAPKWQVRNLGKVGENLDNRRVPITSSERIAGDVPYYGASGVVDYVQGFIFDEDLLCVSEDGANLVARTYPITFPISGKTWVNNHAHVLRFGNACTQKFIEVYLNSINLDDFITGMAQPKLNKAMLDSIPIPHPDIPEQKKIAACLTSLDDLIGTESQKFEALKTHKKGLMQQLFPSPEEVEE